MDIADQIAGLQLPKDSYLVVGSRVLQALGLRPSDDIDMIVTEPVFDELLARPGWRQGSWDGQLTLQHGPFDIGTRWDTLPIAELLPRALIINGVPYLSLQDLRDWKIKYQRPKDLTDVALIDSYLATLHDKNTHK